ncbi:hypothetical protein Fmac_007839 [Flemingia macrophylla]|uniref:Uncharacterized protein n=1 Tax=Flemingia macrophylla TaxID=520843 RepID=A0ABD1MVS0_9FABA
MFHYFSTLQPKHKESHNSVAPSHSPGATTSSHPPSFPFSSDLVAASVTSSPLPAVGSTSPSTTSTVSVKPVLNLVVDALSHKDANVRTAACICLRSVCHSIKNLSAGCFMDERVVFPLVQLLSDLSTSVQKKIEMEFSRLLNVAEKTTGLFFSYETNLTLSAQRLNDLGDESDCFHFGDR